MAERQYPLAEAAHDLRSAGLLAYALLSTEAGWQIAEPADLPGAFQGATLDSRQVRAQELFVALAGDRADGRDFIGAALAAAGHALTAVPTGAARGLGDPICATPTAPGRVVLVSLRPRLALAHLAICWRARHEARIVAVTGSNGKTTTKDFLAALLGGVGPTLATAGNLNNELGLPLTLLRLRPEHRFAVIELGASAVGEIARLAGWAAPQVGVITNAAEAHLAQFGSLEGVIEGKGELLDALPASGVAILNADSPGFSRWRERARCRTTTFGSAAGDHRWRWQADHLGGGKLELDDGGWPVPLPGPHNAANLTAAILAARALGGEDEALREGLAHFQASAHRSRVLKLNGWQLLDDSYNANPASMRSAVEALLALQGKRSIAVLGAMAELGPESAAMHRATGADLRSLGLDFLLAVGAEAGGLAEGFAAAGGEILRCGDHDEAVAWLRQHKTGGDCVLVKGSRSAAMDVIVKQLCELEESV